MTLHALVVDPDDTDGTHIATALDVASTSAPVSSPPSSSPAVVTPPDCLGEADDGTWEECAHSRSRGKKPTSPFLTRLDDLLLAAQRERSAEGDLSSIQAQEPHPSATGRSSNEPSPRTQQTRKRRNSMMNSTSLAALDADSPTKKRRLSNQRCASRRTSSRHALPSSIARLSGAFRLQYAKGPGSLRRAESLRSELSTIEEEEVLNEASILFLRYPRRRGHQTIYTGHR